MNLHVLSKLIAVPVTRLSNTHYVPSPFSGQEALSEIRVQVNKEVITAQIRHSHCDGIADVPPYVIERQLQDQICREICKRLFGN